jgi:hypothetical protein
VSLAAQISQRTLDALVLALGVTESGAPFMTLKSPMSPAPVGAVRIFGGGGKIRKMVYIGLSVPPIGLDSHMIFAFTEPSSRVPHFTLDSVLAGPNFAFHCDLIPKVDLGANVAYLNAVYQPLTEEYQTVRKLEGLEVAHLSPRQYAIMSPWMLAYRANESAFTKIEASVNRYRDHWFTLLERGESLPVDQGSDPAALAKRDALNKAAIFNPEIDPVWNNVSRLVGEETAARMREILKSPEIERT